MAVPTALELGQEPGQRPGRGRPRASSLGQPLQADDLVHRPVGGLLQLRYLESWSRPAPVSTSRAAVPAWSRPPQVAAGVGRDQLAAPGRHLPLQPPARGSGA